MTVKLSWENILSEKHFFFFPLHKNVAKMWPRAVIKFKAKARHLLKRTAKISSFNYIKTAKLKQRGLEKRLWNNN